MYSGGSAPSARAIASWSGALGRRSLPRITWLIRRSRSSTTEARWYVGRPSARTSVIPAKRSAPSSSGSPIAAPASRCRSARSLWRKGPSSQPTPSHSSSLRISSSDPDTTRAGSVSSIRRTKAPPWSSAKRRFATAVSAPPRWSDPVGLGAKRTRTPMTLLDLGVLLEVPAGLDRRLGLPGGVLRRVGRLDLRERERELVERGLLVGAVELVGRDEHVGERDLQELERRLPGLAAREHGALDVLPARAREPELGRGLARARDDEEILEDGLACASSAAGPARLRMADAPAEREHVDLVLVLGVRALARDAVELQEIVHCHRGRTLPRLVRPRGPRASTLRGVSVRTTPDSRAALPLVAPHVHHTPLLGSRTLSDETGFDVRLKAELFQRTGS